MALGKLIHAPMSLGKLIHAPKLTLLGAMVALVGLAVLAVLVGGGSANVTSIVVLVTLMVPALGSLYQAQINSTKADTAASAANEAKDTAAALSEVADQIHHRVNGGLEAAIRSVLVDILEAHLGIPEQAPAAAVETSSSPARPPFPVSGS